MRNKVLTFMFLALVIATAAYAGGEGIGAGSTDASLAKWEGFWDSVGGFVYNSMPWNWGDWMGK